MGSHAGLGLSLADAIARVLGLTLMSTLRDDGRLVAKVTRLPARSSDRSQRLRLMTARGRCRHGRAVSTVRCRLEPRAVSAQQSSRLAGIQAEREAAADQ